VEHLTLSVLSELPLPLDSVLHVDHQRHRLCLQSIINHMTSNPNNRHHMTVI
jgi:hypothetical protein